MGGRLLDWLGAGASGDLPVAADMPARLAPDTTALYFATDTQHLFVFDQSGPTWFDIDMAAITAVTTESLQDMIAAFLAEGTGIDLVYDDAGNLLTINCTITQYTDEMAQDAINALIAAGSSPGLTIVYNDAGNAIGFTVNVAVDTDIWGGTSDTKFITPKRLKDWRAPVSIAYAAMITLDGSAGVNFYTTLTGNAIFANPTNFVPGQFGVYHVTQDGTGNRTGTFGSNWKFPGISIGSNVFSTAAGAVDALHYYVRNDGTITCFVIQGITGTPAKLKLDNLSNVDMSTPPTDGQVLKYDNASGKWKPATASEGSAALYGINAPSFGFSTWVNQGTATKTTQSNGVVTVISSLGDGSTQNINGVFSNLPSTPYSYTFTFIPTLQKVNYQDCGIALRESSSGKLVTFGTYRENIDQLWLIANFNSPTSKNANVLLPAAQYGFNGPVFLTIADDGTTRTASFGWDPYYQPFAVYSVSHTSFITADQIGIYTNNINTTTRCGISVFSQT